MQPEDATKPAPEGLSVERSDHGTVAVFHVAGEVDVLTAPRLDRAMADVYGTRVTHVVLDLTEVPFLSSAGLSVLVDHHARGERDGIGLSVVASRRATLRAIQITALDRIIPLYATMDQALAAVQS
ncbi:MAG TPA: STAS domain-containing protein [Pseudonocardiaceae bacterium]|nr:STAS domain-containing protein [Pseudonocardiaceae bacterium]